MMGLYYDIRNVIINNFFKALIITIPMYLLFIIINKKVLKKVYFKKYMYIVEFSFIGYLSSVLILTEALSTNLFNVSMRITPNLIPLITNLNDLLQYPTSVLPQIVLNMILFVPFGFILMIFSIKEPKAIKILTYSFIFSSLIEFIQYFSGRYSDVDDIIWNVLGTLLGIIIYKFSQKIIVYIKK